MFTPSLKLNPNLFADTIERVPTRFGFGDGLVLAGKKNTRVVALCADLTASTKMDGFAKAFPERFIQMGIGEQSMASVASGLAAAGKIPFFASYAMFSPGRNWEQIRTTICYNNVNAKVVGAHAGVSVGPDGGTHQAIEDIALMRVIPHMTVVVPCDAHEAHRATLALAEYNGPAYLRLTREPTPLMTTSDTPFAIGKAQIFFEPKRGVKKTIGIIGAGPVLYEALLTAKDLEGEGIGVSVMNLATIKPLDEEAVLSFAKAHKALVTVEEHQIAGGLGSTIAEYLSSVYPMHIVRIGVRDAFGQSGTQKELIAHYGMDKESIKREIRNVK
ncbi:MAG: transketolase family protein [Candidatus Yonathbacteria bacterium]|nr:transketolase family protein [Candidatus Yonathbacteria bacterium]NTW47465.1 transketolase family protein [Candidatus Yonathbacteria bacterium]